MADPFADELVAILRVCQTAADEGELLKDGLRAFAPAPARGRRWRSSASAASASTSIASDGARLGHGHRRRAASAGITIAPHRLHDRIEAAAPIAYGGEPIGALCARWTIGSTYDTSRAASVLTMSAAAAAPMLAAVDSQADAAPTQAPSELLGLTPAMVALRQSVERAAAAPFARPRSKARAAAARSWWRGRFIAAALGDTSRSAR